MSAPVPAITDHRARRLAQYADRARVAVKHRDMLIVETARRGASTREIAEHVGLGHATVARIIARANAEATS